MRGIIIAAALVLVAGCATDDRRPSRHDPAQTAQRSVERETDRVIRSTIGRTSRQIERGIWRR